MCIHKKSHCYTYMCICKKATIVIHTYVCMYVHLYGHKLYFALLGVQYAQYKNCLVSVNITHSVICGVQFEGVLHIFLITIEQIKVCSNPTYGVGI